MGTRRTDEVRRDVLHDRRLVDARVAALHLRSVGGDRSQRPVGACRHRQGQVEHDIVRDEAHRLVVSAVPVDEQDAFEARPAEGRADIAQDPDIGVGAERDGAGEQVMVGIAEGHERRQHDRAGSIDDRKRPPADGVRDQGVGQQGEMFAMLLGGTDRQDDDGLWRQFLDVFPGQAPELDNVTHESAPPAARSKISITCLYKWILGGASSWHIIIVLTR